MTLSTAILSGTGSSSAIGADSRLSAKIAAMWPQKGRASRRTRR